MLASLYACAAFGTSSTPSEESSNDGGTLDADADGSSTSDTKDDASASWCAAHAPAHSFCADFDSVQRADEGWALRIEGDAEVELGAPGPGPRQRSAKMTMAAAASGNCRFAELIYRSSQPQKSGHLEFDVWLETGGITLTRFGHDGCAVDIGGHSSVYVELDSSGTNGGSKDFDTPIPLKTWTRVTIDFDFGAGTYTASHDHAMQSVSGAVSNSCNTDGVVKANIGIHCHDATAATVYFDNIIMTPR